MTRQSDKKKKQKNRKGHVLWREWEALPDFMRTEAVRPYYDSLNRKKGQLFLKRVFDFTVSSLMLAALSPVLAVLAILIRLDSEGPVFYRQERVTQYGRRFRIYKFRTMIQDADKKGSLVTTQGDARITRMGKKLRGCRLDELPQLINIWKGYDILVCEEFSCLEFHTDRDTINWILKIEYRRSSHGKTTQKNHGERHRLCSRR